MRTFALLLSVLLVGPVVALAAAQEAEFATVTTTAGDVYFGRVTRNAESVRLEGTDGSVTAFPRETVASVVPTASTASTAATAIPAGTVVRAVEPSPPPPPVPGTFVRTAAPRVVDVDRSVMAAAATQAAAACAPDPCWESPWTFRAGLALGLGRGNSDFFDVRVDGGVEREPTPWGLKVAFTYVYGERDGDVSANNWKVLARTEREFGGRNYVFGQVLYERDPLADLTYRWTLTVGVGRTFIDTAANTLKGEVGLGATIEKRTNRDQTVDPSGWLGLDYEHRWSETCRFKAIYAFRPNFSDFDLSASTLELKYIAPCFRYVNFAVGLRLDHVIDPPEDDIESLDLLFTVGLTFEK